MNVVVLLPLFVLMLRLRFAVCVKVGGSSRFTVEKARIIEEIHGGIPVWLYRQCDRLLLPQEYLSCVS